MDLSKRFNSFEFDNDRVFDDEINSVRLRYFYPLVYNGQRLLSFNSQAKLLKFQGQASLIDLFKQAWPKVAMHLNSRSNNPLGQCTQVGVV